jgi:tRNA(Ile)-lysidine synthase
MDLVLQVRQTIERRQLLAAGDRVAIAVSGGADSVALTRILLDLQPGSEWTIAGLIHVNHRIRPGEADDDEEFVRALGDRLSLRVDVTRVDVPALAMAERRSLEAAARDARYGAFEEAAVRLGASVVVTGHTLDDQAETVMLRLLRGAGARGLGGIRGRRGVYRRPLLECRRSDLRAFLLARRESYREDSSNQDLRVTRNRLRHSLMPILERDWPGSIRALGRVAEQAGEDEAWLEAEAGRTDVIRVLPSGSGVQLNIERLRALPAALARRVVRQAVEMTGGRASLADVDAVRALAWGGSGRARDLHRIRVRMAGADLELTAAARPGGERPMIWHEWALPVPGAVTLGETGVTIRASFSTSAPARRETWGDPARAVLQGASVSLPLVVRHRRAGDRLRPLGAPGSRRVQDLFVDRKVPRSMRDNVPLVVDASGRIVWVAGLAVADECRVTAPESGVVILEMKKGTQ